ncbi:MAG: hypothetical protein P4L76_13400 [Beijerinckiaceae bacterium]|nr:hypothetical protein [Beijerinckiaceae bacterium]
MVENNQWARWQRAIEGHRIETERGNPPSGYFMQPTKKPDPQHLEAICVYRDEDGTLRCIRNVFGDGSNMNADQIEELVASCCFYPISYETYVAVAEEGAPWPPEYATRLTMKEQAAGVAWTPALGRKKLGLDLAEAAPSNAVEKPDIPISIPDWDNHIHAYRVKIERATSKDDALAIFEEFDIDGLPRVDKVRMETMLDTVNARFDAREAAKKPAKAVAGHNGPPEPILDDHPTDEEPTPDEKLTAEHTALAMGCKAWLEAIGGKPRNKAEADKLGDYATAFGRIKKSAEDQHKVEKAPVLESGRLIDGKWFRTRDNAEGARKRCLTIVQEWIDTENKRLAEETRKANEDAERIAAKHAEQFDAPITAPPPAEPERITSVGSMRAVSTRLREVWVVSDPAAFAAYLCALENPPAELLEVLGKLANKLGASIKSGVIKEIPGISPDVKRSAA